MIHSHQAGVTLMELLLVIGIISIIATVAWPFGARSFILQQHLSTTRVIQSFLSKAQAYTTGTRDDTTWGVCLTGNTIRLYQNSCLSPAIHEDYTVPASITISNLSDVTFDAVRGAPSSSVAIDVDSATKQSTITVNDTGMIEVN